MVDVTAKSVTKRTAVAAGALLTTPDVVALIFSGGLPKGDALATARVAGIQAAKRTSELIPLCHQLALTGVDVEFEIAQSPEPPSRRHSAPEPPSRRHSAPEPPGRPHSAAVEITVTVRSTDRTGVEMEALTAVSVAALTLYDMIKAVDKSARIDNIRLLRKDGGKSGSWAR
jgi:cyclic pyranopterin monophosphate synthase